MKTSICRPFIAVAVALVVSSCVAYQIRPAGPLVKDYQFHAKKDQVLEAAVISAHRLNLNVAVIEKHSGLIRFENGALDAQQLEKYAAYPALQRGANKVLDTFIGWNQRSMEAGLGPVRGNVSLTLLVSKSGNGMDVNLRSNFTGGNNRGRYTLDSTGVLETELIDMMRGSLQGRIEQ